MCSVASNSCHSGARYVHVHYTLCIHVHMTVHVYTYAVVYIQYASKKSQQKYRYGTVLPQ